MTKQEAIKIATVILLDDTDSFDFDTRLKITQTMLKAKNGDKESVMVLYHSLVEHEKLISKVKQALKEE